MKKIVQTFAYSILLILLMKSCTITQEEIKQAKQYSKNNKLNLPATKNSDSCINNTNFRYETFAFLYKDDLESQQINCSMVIEWRDDVLYFYTFRD